MLIAVSPVNLLLMNRLIFSLTIALALGLFSCMEMPSDWQDMTIEDIAVEIDKEVDDARANQVSECQIIPIGYKPCGGIRGYLVYSERESSENKLSKLVSIYNELDEKRSRDEKLVSICDVAVEPPLALKRGSCTGTNIYAWNPGDILEFNDLE